MKRSMIILRVVLLAACVALSVFAGSVTAQPEQGTTSIELPEACDKCGMSRSQFAFSRVLVEYEDGSTTGTCSITCAADVIRQQDVKKVKRFLVADYVTRELIDVHTAVWVVGGKKRGVMTTVPKWAFAKKEAADGFVGRFGGKITPFDDVIKAAKQETCNCGKHGDHKKSHGESEMPCHDKNK
jgi:nitrous oxide reductase accessory protein NosL